MIKIEEKPANMSVREYLSKLLGKRENISERVISSVVTHEYDSANAALQNKNSIEISGFGKFYYNVKKAERTMQKCLSQKKAYQEILDKPGISDKKRHANEQKIITVEKNIAHLIKRNGK